MTHDSVPNIQSSKNESQFSGHTSDPKKDPTLTFPHPNPKEMLCCSQHPANPLKSSQLFRMTHPNKPHLTLSPPPKNNKEAHLSTVQSSRRAADHTVRGVKMHNNNCCKVNAFLFLTRRSGMVDCRVQHCCTCLFHARSLMMCTHKRTLYQSWCIAVRSDQLSTMMCTRRGTSPQSR